MVLQQPERTLTQFKVCLGDGKMFERPSAAARPLLTWGVLHACLLFALSVPSSIGLAALAPGAQDGSGDHVITANASLVVLPVTVRDRHGRFVSGLSASNFQVYEDRKLQMITLFRNQDMPVTVGLVVDHSGSMAAKQLEVLEGAQAFVQDSNPQDREFVVNFNSRVSFGLPENVAFTSDVSMLRTALSSTAASGTTALYDALLAAIQRFEQDQDYKNVVLVISDGGDNASKSNFPQVLRTAQSTNVTIYAIGLFDEQSTDQNPKILTKLTEETGGLAYFPSSYSQIINDCQEIGTDVRHQYTLGYVPTDHSGGGYHKIRVGVNAPGRGRLTVRTRVGYLSPPRAQTESANLNGQAH
jgi:Ca-activated chloride channel family protein